MGEGHRGVKEGDFSERDMLFLLEPGVCVGKPMKNAKEETGGLQKGSYEA